LSKLSYWGFMMYACTCRHEVMVTTTMMRSEVPAEVNGTFHRRIRNSAAGKPGHVDGTRQRQSQEDLLGYFVRLIAGPEAGKRKAPDFFRLSAVSLGFVLQRRIEKQKKMIALA